ncbi:MAG TPA: hypothetical protein VNN98_06465 [Rhizomicrobium sp.]|nr:hypothetical protein [Rhizomicrobium sp.]
MRNKHLLILAALLLASPAAAQQHRQPEDHLEPEGAILGGTAFSASYDMLVRDLLHDAYDMSVDVRMVALPSFVPEYAVGLRSFETTGTGAVKRIARGAPYRIFVLSPQAQIWTYESISSLKRGQEQAFDKIGNSRQQAAITELEAKVPTNPHDLKIDRCEADISGVLGDRIVQLWGKMLLATRYSAQYSAGADGVSYHFSASVPKAGMLAGQVWTPDRNSATSTLVTLADAMRAVCEKKATMTELDRLTTELEQRLRKGEGR